MRHAKCCLFLVPHSQQDLPVTLCYIHGGCIPDLPFLLHHFVNWWHGEPKSFLKLLHNLRFSSTFGTPPLAPRLSYHPLFYHLSGLRPNRLFWFLWYLPTCFSHHNPGWGMYPVFSWEIPGSFQNTSLNSSTSCLIWSFWASVSCAATYLPPPLGILALVWAWCYLNALLLSPNLQQFHMINLSLFLSILLKDLIVHGVHLPAYLIRLLWIQISVCMLSGHNVFFDILEPFVNYHMPSSELPPAFPLAVLPIPLGFLLELPDHPILLSPHPKVLVVASHKVAQRVKTPRMLRVLWMNIKGGIHWLHFCGLSVMISFRIPFKVQLNHSTNLLVCGW